MKSIRPFVINRSPAPCLETFFLVILTHCGQIVVPFCVATSFSHTLLLLGSPRPCAFNSGHPTATSLSLEITLHLKVAAWLAVIHRARVPKHRHFGQVALQD